MLPSCPGWPPGDNERSSVGTTMNQVPQDSAIHSKQSCADGVASVYTRSYSYTHGLIRLHTVLPVYTRSYPCPHGLTRLHTVLSVYTRSHPCPHGLIRVHTVLSVYTRSYPCPNGLIRIHTVLSASTDRIYVIKVATRAVLLYWTIQM